VRDFFLLLAGAALSLLGGLVQQLWAIHHGERSTSRLRRVQRQEDALIQLHSRVVGLQEDVAALVHDIDRVRDARHLNAWPRIHDSLTDAIFRVWDEEMVTSVYEEGVIRGVRWLRFVTEKAHATMPPQAPERNWDEIRGALELLGQALDRLRTRCLDIIQR
jgi:hypothetical protein